MNHIEASKQAYIETIEAQGRKGMEKYGQAMNPMEPGRDWLQMTSEELVDGHQYIEAEKIRRKKCCCEIRAFLADGDIDSALFWVDVLEGKR